MDDDNDENEEDDDDDFDDDASLVRGGNEDYDAWERRGNPSLMMIQTLPLAE